MKNIQKRVAQFNADAGTQLGQHMLLPNVMNNEIDMLQEELDELRLAAEGLVAVRDPKTGKKYHRQAESTNEIRVEKADALGDIIYVALGTLSKLGMDAEQLLTAICDSNDTKYVIDSNGKKILNKNESGKIMKSANFKDPNIEFTSNVDNLLVSELLED